jgi:hypothetical protein
MSALECVPVPRLASVSVSLVPPATVALSGTLTSMNPAEELAGFFRAVHAGAVKDKAAEIRVDVSGLTFVNSSSIRLFVDWAIRAKDDPFHPYTLRFLTSRHITWQKTAFMALTSLIGNKVVIEHVD